MARSRKTPVEKFQAAVNDILKEYEGDVEQKLFEIIPNLAKEGAKGINRSAGQTFSGKKYRRSWKATVEEGRLRTTATIHSKEYQLPHLLEFGHLNRNGSRTDGRAHIAPIETELINELQKQIRKELGE